MHGVRDWAPLIVVGVMTAWALFLLWLAVREAHSGERKALKAARQAEQGAPPV